MATAVTLKLNFCGSKTLSAAWNGPRQLLLAALVLAGIIIWAQPGEPLLRGTDAGVYAQVAKEMSQRSLGHWVQLTLDGAPFHEHPPGLMFLLAAAFTCLGATPHTAILTAHVLMTLEVALCAGIASALAGPYAAAASVLGLCVLSGFYVEAHNPMLELPTAVGLSLGVWGLAAAGRARRGSLLRGLSMVAAVIGPVGAAWSKGPVALAYVPIAAVLVLRGVVSLRLFIGCLICSGLLTTAGFAWFDAAQKAAGVSPFLGPYLREQVWPSMVQGRHHAVSDPTFYVPILRRWYAAGLALMPMTGALCVRHRARSPAAFTLWLLGAMWLATVVLGFSCMRQKYQWYVHVALPAFALCSGAGLAALPPRWQRPFSSVLCGAAVSAALALAGLGLLDAPRLRQEPVCLAALGRLPAAPPAWPGHRRRLSCCAGPSGWRERYVALFVHDATWVPCDVPADARYTPLGWVFGERADPPPAP